MTEREFQNTVIDMARLLGWKVAHFRPAQTSQGWRTPVEADAKGFPDLVLVRERIVYLELKSATGKVTPEQADWIAAINAADGTALVVRPTDIDKIEHALKKRMPPTRRAA